MIEWLNVSDDVIEMADRLIKAHHPDLSNGRIAFSFIDPAPNSRGRVTAGKALKISNSVKSIMDPQVDFLIWLGFDVWQGLTLSSKEGLLDHELTHCTYDDKQKPLLRHHDIEEFFTIVKRHGNYRPEINGMYQAIEVAQQASLFKLDDELIPTLISMAPDLIKSKKATGVSEATIQAAKNGIPFGPIIDLDTGEVIEKDLTT